MVMFTKYACRWILNFLKNFHQMLVKCEQYYFTAIIHLSACIQVHRPQFFILPKSFLASCVPDLKFDRLSSDIHNLATKLYPNRVVRIFLDWKFKKEFKNYWCLSFFFNYTINLVNFVSVLQFLIKFTFWYEGKLRKSYKAYINISWMYNYQGIKSSSIENWENIF